MIDELIYVLPDHVGGVATVIGNLLKYSRSSLRKTVILLRTSQEGIIPYKFKCDRQIVVNINQRQSLSSIYESICQYITPNSVVISNDGWYEIEALIYCKKNNPLAYILHGNFPHYYQQIRQYSNRISKVITVSSFLKTQAEKYYNGNIEFIRFPINNSDNVSEQKFSETPIIINYAGRLEVAKGTQFFPQLVSMMDESGLDYKFNIFGTGEHYDLLLDKFKYNSRVKLWGQRPQEDILKSNLYAHINLLFSQTEGLPVCVVEAMKAAMVPIVFDLPSGIPDIIQNNINGFILQQGDIVGVYGIIEKLNNDRNFLKEIAISAKLFANEKFNPFTQAETYETTLVSLNSISDEMCVVRRQLLKLPSPMYYSVNGYFKKISSMIKK